MATESVFDTSNVGVAKGRPGGYAAIFPADTEVAKLSDMTKTIKQLIDDEAITGGASLGYISEDGVEFSTDTSTADNSDWGGTQINSDISEYSESAQVTFLESRESVLKAVYGEDNVVTASGTTTIKHNKNFTDPHVYVFDAVISSTKVKRSIIPVGRIFERDSVTMNSSDMMGYTPTIKCMPYDDDGDTYVECIYDSTAA